VASNTTSIIPNGAPANVSASVTPTSNNIVVNKRVRAKAPPSPSKIPMTASDVPCRTTILITSACAAPKAIRTPISWVRSVTEYAISP